MGCLCAVGQHGSGIPCVGVAPGLSCGPNLVTLLYVSPSANVPRPPPTKTRKGEKVGCHGGKIV